jgi:tetratricopeptide (TPR) repeat protein
MGFHDRSLKLFLAGRKAEQAGDLEAARRCYCLAVSVDPENLTCIQAAAKLACRMGRNDDARALYQEAIDSAKRSRSYPNAMLTSLVCESLSLRGELGMPPAIRPLRSSSWR